MTRHRPSPNLPPVQDPPETLCGLCGGVKGLHRNIAESGLHDWTKPMPFQCREVSDARIRCQQIAHWSVPHPQWPTQLRLLKCGVHSKDNGARLPYLKPSER